MRSPAAACACLAFAAWSSVTAHAAPWGGTVGLSSDYVFRGVSRSDGEPVLHAGLHARFAGRWFAGAWASSLRPSAGVLGRVELNLEVGRGWDLTDDWAVSTGWARYLYPDARDPGRYDWDELSASLVYVNRLALTASLSPNVPHLYAFGVGERTRATALEASWRQPLAGPWALVAAAGRYDTSAPSSPPYLAWNAGLSAQVRRFEITLARYGIDGAGQRQFGSAAARGRWVFSLTWRYASP